MSVANIKSFRIERIILTLAVLNFMFGGSPSVMAQGPWLDWQNETTSRLILTTVANSDGEEKDMWPADLNNDGREDLIVVRKEPFSNSTQPGKSNLLLMNVNGVFTDQTTLFAPEFISNVNFARDVFVGDFDHDNWKDVIIANTFSQQPMYYRNRGNDALGNWLGLVNESSLRFPVLTDDSPLFCAVWGGDVTGDNHADIYFVNYKPNSSGGIAKDYLLINNGNGYFTNESQARLGILRNSAFGTAVQFADMDNDGDNDIIKNTTLYSVAPWNARGVILLFNNGSGTFTNWQNLVTAASPYMFEIADFNQDGKKDLYVVDDGSDYILTTNSFTADTGLFITRTNLNFSSSNGFGGNVHAADLDLDGDLDIGVADVDVDIPPCNSSRRMAIYRNDNGVFTNPNGVTIFPWTANSYDFAFIDVNGDGLKDVISGSCAGYILGMNDNCGLAPLSADYDLDGLADACDPCPANPDPNCAPSVDYPTVSTTGLSVARQWNELLLASIRKDFARPTVHARNLFHLSAAMWDVWSAYDSTSCGFLLGQTVNNFTLPFNGVPVPASVSYARKKAISYAAYRLLKHRFANSPQGSLLLKAYAVHMDSLGFDTAYVSTNYAGGNPGALGNYIAQGYINFGLQDGSNEQNAYTNTSYAPVNPSLNVDVPGNPNIVDYNRWQPLTLNLFIDQSGNPIPGATPPFLSPEWGQVVPFALSPSDLTVNTRNGFNYKVYHDPGAPPMLQMNGGGTSPQYKYGFELVSVWSSHLDPSDSVKWDISPATMGNRNNLPTNVADYPNFYNLIDGGTSNTGYSQNPVTGQPYTPNLVPRGDYARVLAEFWADGPDSETPPGHWFTLFNYVTDHPLQTRKFKGAGNPLDALEWDVKGYFALGGAMHDVAISVWGIKGWYDYLRPISAIRAMADLGQCSDSTTLSYHPAGITLIPGYIELVLPGDLLADGGANVGKIKLYAWRGHSVIDNVDVDEAGVGWILAEDWMPYQRPSFVTPPFAGYISGHSTYSRAAAEILTKMTGSKYFPGGLGVFTAVKDQFLVFEDGPSQDIQLQWATYQDAADESSLSRIWGGIHPPCDDIPGRLIATTIADDVFSKAELHYNCCQLLLPAKPGGITVAGGVAKVCPGESRTYSIAAVQGATAYEWIVPAGAVINSGQGTVSVNVSYNPGFTVNDSLKVRAMNTCGGGEYRSLLVRRNIPSVPGTISGLNSGLCNVTAIPYSVSPVNGMLYNWSFNAPGATILSGQGNPSVQANFSAAFSTAMLSVTAQNGCGISAARTLAVKAIPAKTSVVSGAASVCANQQAVPYSITPNNPVTSYLWKVPSGARIFDGTVLSTTTSLTTTSPSVTVNFKTTAGNISVYAVNTCGQSEVRRKVVSMPCREGDVEDSFNVSAFPNPSAGDFIFSIEGRGTKKVHLQLYDILGQLIFSKIITDNSYLLQEHSLPAGIYTAVFTTNDDQRSLRIIKQE